MRVRSLTLTEIINFKIEFEEATGHYAEFNDKWRKIIKKGK